jgi:hypothetical protein
MLSQMPYNREAKEDLTTKQKDSEKTEKRKN